MLAVPTGHLAARVVSQISGTYIVSAQLDWQGSVLRSLDSGFVQLLLAQYGDEEVARVLEAAMGLDDRPRRGVLDAVQDARTRGYVIVDDATERGLTGIGAAFYGERSVTAMLAVYLPSFRVDDTLVSRALDTFQGTARSTGTRLTPR